MYRYGPRLCTPEDITMVTVMRGSNSPCQNMKWRMIVGLAGLSGEPCKEVDRSVAAARPT